MTVCNALVFGYGNPSRGDDALGPLLVSRLESELFPLPEGVSVEFLTDFQLQIEHALDIEARTLVLFADAHVSCPAPFTLDRIEASRDDSFTTHAMTPAALLHVYGQVRSREPPPCFILSIRGERFGLGEALSPSAERHLEAAVCFAKRLFARPSLKDWERCSRRKETRDA